MSEQDQKQDQDLTLSTLPELDEGSNQEEADEATETQSEQPTHQGPEPMPLWFKLGLGLMPFVLLALAFGAYTYLTQDKDAESQTPAALIPPAKEPPRPAPAREAEPDQAGQGSGSQESPAEAIGPGGYVIQGLDKATPGAVEKEPSAGKEPSADKQPSANKKPSTDKDRPVNTKPAPDTVAPALLDAQEHDESQENSMALIRDTRTRIERLEGYIMEFIAIADEHRAQLTQINETLSDNRARLAAGEARLAELAQALENSRDGEASTSKPEPVSFPFQVRSYRQMGGIQSIRISEDGHCCQLMRMGQQHKGWRLAALDINSGRARFEHSSGQTRVEVF